MTFGLDVWPPPRWTLSHPAIRALGVPLLVAVGLAAGTLLGIPLEEPGYVIASVALLVVIEIIAIVTPWHRFTSDSQLPLALATLLALGLIRAGTGGANSMFVSLTILPLVWGSMIPRRRVVPLVIGVTIIAVLLPYLVGQVPIDVNSIIRLGFTVVIYGVISTILNMMSRAAQRRMRAMSEISQERARLLEESTRDQARLSAATTELLRAEEFSYTVWSALDQEAVIVTDLDGHIQGWGPGAEALLGYASDDMCGDDLERDHAPAMPAHPVRRARSSTAQTRRRGEHLASLVIDTPGGPDSPAIDTASMFAHLLAIGRSPDRGYGRLTLRDAQGAPIPVTLSCSPRRAADGTEVGYAFVARDIRYLQQLDRLKDEFVGTVSHELRTPLSSILGYVELLRDDEAHFTDEQRRFLDVIDSNAHRLLNLVGDLLFTAQVEAGKLAITREAADLAEIARASATAIEPVAASAGVMVVLDLPAAPVVGSVDPGRIRQAIDNLVSNAVKFTPHQGHVTIALRSEVDADVIDVVDTGPGISEEDLAHLAERFFRTETASRAAVPGVGLGLSITKSIIQAHGGVLTASSTPGEGTTFSIRLPRGPRHDDATPDESAADG